MGLEKLTTTEQSVEGMKQESAQIVEGCWMILAETESRPLILQLVNKMQLSLRLVLVDQGLLAEPISTSTVQSVADERPLEP